MSTTAQTNDDDRLMRYFDEELSSEEMEIVRAELDGDDELAAKLDGLVHVRELVGEAMEGVGADLDADAMFAAVEAKLDEAAEDDEPMFPAPVADEEPAEVEDDDEEDERPPLRVVPGGKQDAVPAEVVREEPPSRTGMWIGMAGALAAAAAVLFFLLRPPSDGGTDPVPDEPLAAAPAGSEIEDVDFGYSTGSIFTVEDPEAEAQYAVIWISDEKIGEEEDEEATPEGTAPEGDTAPEEDTAPEGSAPEDPAPEETVDAPPTVEGAPPTDTPDEEAE